MLSWATPLQPQICCFSPSCQFLRSVWPFSLFCCWCWIFMALDICTERRGSAHFTAEETGAQRGKMTCPQPHRSEGCSKGSDLGQFDPKVLALYSETLNTREKGRQGKRRQKSFREWETRICMKHRSRTWRDRAGNTELMLQCERESWNLRPPGGVSEPLWAEGLVCQGRVDGAEPDIGLLSLQSWTVGAIFEDTTLREQCGFENIWTVYVTETC